MQIEDQLDRKRSTDMEPENEMGMDSYSLYSYSYNITGQQIVVFVFVVCSIL